MSDSKTPTPHIDGKWCADLHCKKCYSADVWQKSALTAALARVEEVKRERDANEKSLNMLYGEQFSDRAYTALKYRAEKAERELAEARKNAERYREVIMWALGERDAFPCRPVSWDALDFKPWYWWRSELRSRMVAIDAAIERGR